jgi:hypothetical protein
MLYETINPSLLIMENYQPPVTKEAPSTLPASVKGNQTITNSPGKNSFLLILFGILLILLSVFSTFLFVQNQKLKKGVAAPIQTPNPTQVPTPTSNPTSDWKTYTDPADLYSFKYPDNFEESPYTEGAYQGVSVVYRGPKQGRKEGMLADGLIVKTLVINDSKLSAQEYATQMRSKELNVPQGDTPPNVSEIQSRIIAGKTTHYYSSEGLGNAIVYFLDLDGNLLEITVGYAGGTEEIEKYLQQADEILATLNISG